MKNRSPSPALPTGERAGAGAFCLRTLSVSLRWEERGGRGGVFCLRALSVSLRREERGGRGGVLVAADAAGTIGIGRLALPALLDVLDILGGGISRLTRGIAPSHWRQPYPLPGWGETERGCFTFNRPSPPSPALSPAGERWRGAFLPLTAHLLHQRPSPGWGETERGFFTFNRPSPPSTALSPAGERWRGAFLPFYPFTFLPLKVPLKIILSSASPTLCRAVRDI